MEGELVFNDYTPSGANTNIFNFNLKCNIYMLTHKGFYVYLIENLFVWIEVLGLLDGRMFLYLLPFFIRFKINIDLLIFPKLEYTSQSTF
jgi:hypothetical protein